MLFLLLFSDRAPAAFIVFCCWVFLEYRNLIWNATVNVLKLSNSQIVVCATIRQVRVDCSSIKYVDYGMQ